MEARALEASRVIAEIDLDWRGGPRGQLKSGEISDAPVVDAHTSRIGESY
jgi:hypothetical protein